VHTGWIFLSCFHSSEAVSISGIFQPTCKTSTSCNLTQEGKTPYVQCHWTPSVQCGMHLPLQLSGTLPCIAAIVASCAKSGNWPTGSVAKIRHCMNLQGFA
jgi:hypothetical protein